MSQDDYARAVIQEGQRRGLTPRGITIALATALVESNLLMYANDKVPASLALPHDAVGSDGYSVGLFQQQVRQGSTGQWWWGDAAMCMDPAKSAGLFYSRLVQLNYNGPNTPGSYAQAVQQSAYPDRYDLHMSDAQALYDRLVGFAPTSGEITVPVNQPTFTEIQSMGSSSQSRNGARITNFYLHTQEGDGTAQSLAAYLNNPQNSASYHYTVRDGVVVDVVDTDLASWSVLDANNSSINLCFAGSFAAWSRDQWLQRESDIEIAAYIAVQDCKKYGFSTEVIPPPYHRADGISDHRYVTECLGIGSHTDCGDGFPWDVFTNYVNKWAGTAQAPSSKTSEDDVANSWGDIITNLDGEPVSREDMIKYLDKHVNQLLNVGIAILDQLAGPGVGQAVANGQAAAFDGFPQGGDRSLYNLAAAIAAVTKVSGAQDIKESK